LDDDADARPPEQPDALAIGDRRVGVRRPPDLAHRVVDRIGRRHVEERHVLAGEARVGAVLVDRGRAHRQRHREVARGPHDLLDRAVRARCDGLDEVARQRDAGRQRQPFSRRRAEPDRLRPVDRVVVGFRERDDPCHASTVTVPASPSTRTRAPSAILSVASRVPTTPGIPYSRATIAEWESKPPLSVTIAPSNGRRMLNASVVDWVTRTSPLTIRSNSAGPETRRAGPSYTPRLAASPRSTCSSCSSSEL